jgi:outer membrane protein assembly factor BamB
MRDRGTQGATSVVQLQLAWEFQTSYWIKCAPAVVNDLVLIGSADGFLYCIDADSARLVWRLDVGVIEGSDVIYSAPCVANDGVIVGSKDRAVYCLALDDGNLR